jgi:hypothetical protein
MLPNSKAQATIEFTIAFIACILFLIGITKIFVWVNQCIVERQVRYQETRGDPLGFKNKRENINNFYTNPPKLRIFE